VSEQNKPTICASPLDIDDSQKVLLNSSQQLQRSSSEMIIVLYVYCITIIYINDLPLHFRDLEIDMFADDTTLKHQDIHHKNYIINFILTSNM
jgi:hypothetical protein